VAAAAVTTQPVLPVSVEALLSLQQLMWRHDEPAVRQLSFMLLQKLAGQPATLYRYTMCHWHVVDVCLYVAYMVGQPGARCRPGNVVSLALQTYVSVLRQWCKREGAVSAAA
jgi:hypothetical protein